MSERGAEFDAKREAYEARRKELARIIDAPDSFPTTDEYRGKIKAAKRAVHRAHGEMLAAW